MSRRRRTSGKAPWTTDSWNAKPEDKLAAEELGMIWDGTPDIVWAVAEGDKKLIATIPPIAMPDPIKLPISTRKEFDRHCSSGMSGLLNAVDPNWRARLKSLEAAGVKSTTIHIRGENNGAYPYPRVLLDYKKGKLAKNRRDRISEIIKSFYPKAFVVFGTGVNRQGYCTNTSHLHSDEYIAMVAMNKLRSMVVRHEGQVRRSKEGTGPAWITE